MSNDAPPDPVSTRLPASARRCPPERSVSLRQASARQAAQRNVQVAAGSKGESAASSLVNNRDSSGESSNVDNWFDRSNNNLDNEAHSRLASNEPPFFLRNNSSSGSGPTNPHVPIHYPSKLLHSTGSSSEEYRSVIDDLTIQNKRLKERLRRYEQMNSPHLQSEQLFELRVHGLPAERKRQLEDLLRGFTQSVTAPPKSTKQSQASKNASVAAKPTASLTSTRFAADSGYGSMMTPNQASASKTSMLTSASNAASGSNSGMLSMTASDMNAKDRSMQSYLRDTSSSLLPTNAAGLSERAKKKLVVLRLEQIFGGRGALPESTGQPAQQQELSDIAARDDRTAFGALADSNSDEGAREARIMLSNAPADNNSPGEEVPPSDAIPQTDNTAKAGPEMSSPYLEQRPTRPLDLDPARAQVPSDNIEYFRHLGFNMAKSDAKDNIFADSDGWIYANLLFNMAQLHTLNVTTDFAKRAVAEYSDKFELSNDGRKVRWRSNPRLIYSTSMSSDDHDALDGPAKDANPASKRKLSTTASSLLNIRPSRTPLRKGPRALVKERSFLYTPMFHRQSETDEDASMADCESYDSWAEAGGDNSAAATGSGSRALKRRGAGPIIYYNNAYFCTDLSGDGSNSNTADGGGGGDGGGSSSQPLPQQPSMDQSRLPAPTLGLYMSKPRSSSLESDAPPQALIARYFEYDAEPPAKRRALPSDDGDVTPIHFPVGHDSSSKHVSFAESYKALDFEASGLGGATPADNLAITVVKETKPRPFSHKGSTLRPPLTRVDKLLKRNSLGAAVHDRILSVRTSTLKPSTLPEPSVAFAPNDFEDEDEEEESPDPTSANDDMDFGQIPNLVLLDRHPIDSHYSSDDSSQSQASSLAAESGSQAELFDLLATARQIDPQAVLAKEREYEAEMAERLAEDIPAGSSAATAGGGSNNGSPLEGVRKRQNMALSGDGNKTGHGQKHDSSSSSDEDDDDDDDNDSTGVERSISS